MTNLYVSGNTSTYADITSSNTLINANKVTKNFIKIMPRTDGSPDIYLDEDHNLYRDINGTDLIDTDVDDIRPGTYLKNNTIYRVFNGGVLAEQVKEYTIGDLNGFRYICYTDVNNKNCLKMFDSYHNTVPSTYFTRDIVLKSACDNYASYLYLDYEGNLYYNVYAQYSSLTKIADNVKDIIPGCYKVSSNEYGTLFITNEGKVNRFRKSTTASSTPVIEENVLSLDEDEKVLYFLPYDNNTRYNHNVRTLNGTYLIKTNKRVLTNNSRYKGIDPIFIMNLCNISNGSITLACTSLIEYPINIYNADNETIAATLNTLPFKETYLILNGTTASLTVTNIFDETQTVVFETELRKGYEFAGLSQVPNSPIPEIYIGTTPYEGSSELSLYQIYVKALPIDAIDAILYNMSCEENKIDKTNYLTRYKLIRGVFRSSVDILKPHIILQLNEYPAFNYVFLPNFNRYYFVVSKTNVSKDIYDIGLEVDVLYTYKNIIGNNYAVLSRTSNTDLQSPNLVDGKLPLQNNDNVVVIESTQPDVFNVDNAEWNNVYRYVLTAFSGKPLEPVNVTH